MSAVDEPVNRAAAWTDEPVTPAPAPPDEPHLVFHRGHAFPRAIAWLGFRSFWGHLRHFSASAIATEDIDSRDWMHADEPDELTAEVARVLGAAGEGATLVERIGSDLWIDYLADVGDDSSVVGAVADMVLRRYRLPATDHDDGDELTAPRGHLLLFGGDTAYPVATDLEIHNRVCVPFNRLLRDRHDGRARVLLGIPGNHDWYDGLDGFARMFRARRGSVDRRSVMIDDAVDRSGQIGHLFDWVEAFRVGRFVAKRSALPLLGYTPVQGASYFALRLAPDLDMWGIDRQLRAVDFTQRGFFLNERHQAPDRGLVLVVSDPVHTYLEPYELGLGILGALEVTLARDEPLVLVGDTHHFCRTRFGRAMQVVAGGGGAFLHPARILRAGFEPPAAEFPGPRACLALALQIPWQIAGGRSGFMVHTGMALMYAPVLGLHLAGRSILAACVVVALLAAVACALIGGWRERRASLIAALAALCGAWTGAVPYLLREVLAWAVAGRLGSSAQAMIGYVVGIYLGTLGFGTFLMLLTILGLEHNQGFSTLAHPGYKHFVRLRVRRDGSAIDGWVIGKVDTLDPRSPVSLVDRFTWRNPRSRKNPAPDGTHAAGAPGVGANGDEPTAGAPA